MPVTAKLSRVFYEKMGDQVANELVAWFNAVDDTYRQDLLDLNEVNFQRFDAKVEQRFAEAEVKLEKRFAELEVKLEKRFAELEVKWERRFAELGSGVDALGTALRAEIRSAIADAQKETIKYLFGFWVANVATTAGIILTLLRYKG